MKLNLFLYLISQDVNTDYDTYDSAVVVAKNANSARRIHPAGFDPAEPLHTWCEVVHVKVRLVGKAAPNCTDGEVICSSFNAG